MWGGLEHFYRALTRCRAAGPEPTERFLVQSAQQADITGRDLGAVLHELGCFYRDLGCYTQALAAPCRRLTSTAAGRPAAMPPG